MDLAIEGRHALLFDDDSTATFVNSGDALVPCNADASLLIDRHDVRHLLDRIPPRPPPSRHRLIQPEIDADRYLDLPKDENQQHEQSSDGRKQPDGVYQAVPFSYEKTENSTEEPKDSDSGVNHGYRPPFPIPESLMSNLPPSEKLHQIIARTAMFVSEHGGQSEIVLRVKQGDNPTFGFLMPDHHLHAYYRFLVDNTYLLRSNGDAAKLQENNKTVDSADQTRVASGGALSLLGSIYGDDDDDSHQVNNKVLDSNISVATAKAGFPTVATEPSVSKVLKDEEGSKFLSSIISKEKLAAIKRNLAVGSILSSSAGSNKEKNANEAHYGVLPKPGSSHSSQADLKVVVEPPPFLKRTIDKIVDLVAKNGMDFQSILAEQDRTTGRFPFLVPSNQYHPYYLKVLQGVCEGKQGSNNKLPQKSSKESKFGISSELSKERLHDSERKEKLKTVIGDYKKSASDRAPAARQSGMSADEVASIVLAATRGVSPANTVRQSGMSADEAAAVVLAATRGASPSPGAQHFSICKPSSSAGSFSSKVHDSATKPTSSDASIPLRSYTHQLKKERFGMADEEWIEKAIAKTAALAATSEVDSTEASLTKEQKQKAERLKRAKLFASMIKSGNLVDKLTDSDIALTGNMNIGRASSARSGAESETMAKEQEGTSVSFSSEIAGKVTSGESGFEIEHKNKHSSRKHSSRHRRHGHDLDRGEYHNHSSKRHRSESDAPLASGRNDEEPRKKRSSKDRDSKRHRNYSSSDDEHRHRSHRSRHHRRYEEFSEDENQKKQSDKHLESRRKHGSKGSLDASNAASAEVKASDGANEVPSDLRAKVRAMLLETM